MSISAELLVVIIINVLSAGIFIGGLAMAVKFLEKQIERLEEKQDKHNDLISRMYKVENDLDKAHLRIDFIEGK